MHKLQQATLASSSFDRNTTTSLALCLEVYQLCHALAMIVSMSTGSKLVSNKRNQSQPIKSAGTYTVRIYFALELTICLYLIAIGWWSSRHISSIQQSQFCNKSGCLDKADAIKPMMVNTRRALSILMPHEIANECQNSKGLNIWQDRPSTLPPLQLMPRLNPALLRILRRC